MHLGGIDGHATRGQARADLDITTYARAYSGITTHRDHSEAFEIPIQPLYLVPTHFLPQEYPSLLYLYYDRFSLYYYHYI